MKITDYSIMTTTILVQDLKVGDVVRGFFRGHTGIYLRAPSLPENNRIVEICNTWDSHHHVVGSEIIKDAIMLDAELILKVKA